MKPKVITLCGSSKFVDIMSVCAWILERDELSITMGLHLIPEWYFEKEFVSDHLAEHERCAEEMDKLHLRKIDMSDEIFVVDYQGYIGESTKKEISYAEMQGKRVRYFTRDVIGQQLLNKFIPK